MSKPPRYSARKQIIDLHRRDLSDQLAQERAPITLLNEKGAPRFAVLSIQLWELLSRFPVIRAMTSRFEDETSTPSPASEGERTHDDSGQQRTRPNPNYGIEGYMPEHRKAGRARGGGGDLPP